MFFAIRMLFDDVSDIIKVLTVNAKRAMIIFLMRAMISKHGTIGMLHVLFNMAQPSQ